MASGTTTLTLANASRRATRSGIILTTSSRNASTHLLCRGRSNTASTLGSSGIRGFGSTRHMMRSRILPPPPRRPLAAAGDSSSSLLLARRTASTPTISTIWQPLWPGARARAWNRTPALSRSMMKLRATDGKSAADLLVDELQELYEAAKDEFEIASESTASSTIYAASDRESARDALDQLKAVFRLYTTSLPQSAQEGTSARATADPATQQQEQESQIEDLEETTPSSNLVTTNYDPRTVRAEVREEVKSRVGQRVRELENGVLALEERAREK